MKFQIGKNVAIGVENKNEAADHYAQVLGLHICNRTDDWVHVDGGQTQFYFCSDTTNVPAFELIVENVDAAIEFLEHHGWHIDEAVTESAGEPFMRDPFGTLFNIYRPKS